MRKATLPWLLGFIKLTLAATLFFGSSKSSDVDFFDIVDQTTAEYLTAERRGRNLGRRGGSSAAVISPPRNNKYLEASMQIIKGKMVRLLRVYLMHIKPLKNQHRVSNLRHKLGAHTMKTVTRIINKINSSSLINSSGTFRPVQFVKRSDCPFGHSLPVLGRYREYPPPPGPDENVALGKFTQ